MNDEMQETSETVEDIVTHDDEVLDDDAEPRAAIPGDDQTITRTKCAKCGAKAEWPGDLDRTSDQWTRGIDEASGLPNCIYCGTPLEIVPFLTHPVMRAAEALARQDADRAGDAAKPLYQPPIPGLRPPFDFRRALMQAESLERNVAHAEEAWDAAKEQASDCKKTFDGAVDQLRKHIQQMHQGRVDAEFEARRHAERVANGEPLEPARGACISERLTGKPCPICRHAQANLTGVDAEAPSHVAAAAAVGALDHTIDAASMSAAIRAVTGLVVPVSSLASWAPDEYVAVGTYLEKVAAALGGLDPDADAASIPRPLALGTAHVIAEDPGSSCRVCGALMYQLALESGFPDGFPAGQLVGIDCQGDPAAEQAPEPARRPTPRHKSITDRQRAKQARSASEPKKRTAKASLERGAKRSRR